MPYVDPAKRNEHAKRKRREFRGADAGQKERLIGMRSLEEVGLLMGGISKQAVQQIEQRALAKLRAGLIAAGVIDMEDVHLSPLDFFTKKQD